MKNTISSQIEAILFYIAEPVAKKTLAKTLGVGEREVEEALDKLEGELAGRGTRLVRHDDSVLLSTAPEHAELIEKMVREERSRDLGRAGMETLAIVAYRGPVSKRDIEYIRGVNSDYALRTLLLRGLVEKKENEGDGRMVLYSITTDALLHLGLSTLSDLPEFNDVRRELASREAERKAESAGEPVEAA